MIRPTNIAEGPSMPFFRSASVVLLLAFVVLKGTNAQTLKGTILGTVTDTSRGVIPAVLVNLTETNTNFRRSGVTNESGFYAFANLDPGTYRVEIAHPGFRKLVHADIAVEAN